MDWLIPFHHTEHCAVDADKNTQSNKQKEKGGGMGLHNSIWMIPAMLEQGGRQKGKEWKVEGGKSRRTPLRSLPSLFSISPLSNCFCWNSTCQPHTWKGSGHCCGDKHTNTSTSPLAEEENGRKYWVCLWVYLHIVSVLMIIVVFGGKNE